MWKAINTVIQAFKLPDVRKKIIYTLILLGIYRLGVYVPVPGLDLAALKARNFFDLNSKEVDIFQFINVFGGGAMKNFSVFFLGVNPYITSSIVMQLLTMIIPAFERLQKEGPEGRRVLSQYTRYATIGIAIVTALAFLSLFRPYIQGDIFTDVLIVAVLTAGTMFLMWLGEKITEHGIGNGVSLIIFAGIVSQFGAILSGIPSLSGTGGIPYLNVVIVLLLWVAIIIGIIWIQQAERKIPVQYAKRVVGRKMYGGQTTHIPMRINQAGVIPVIFANSVVLFPSTLARFFPNNSIAQFIGRHFNYNSWPTILIEALFVFLFTYFYTAVTFNPTEVADNMKKYSGFIPGIRPGKPTAEYLDRVLSRITFAGAFFLVALTVTPFLGGLFNVSRASYLLGGTGLLIVVGVALDTMKQIESQLLLRQYQGFMK